MASPLGFHLEVQSSQGDPLFGGVKEWLSTIVQDFRNPSSPNYVATLAITIAAYKDNSGVHLNESQLNFVKEFLPHFDYLFIGCLPNKYVISSPDVTKASHRSAFVNANRDAAELFIQWLRTNNITTPIHWYIDWEENINEFGFGNAANLKNGYKELFSQFTSELWNLSINNGINEPEFLWSPYFGSPSGSILERDLLRDLLVSVPKLSWLNVQDGIGVNATKNPNGQIAYNRTPEQVINYYQNVIGPASGPVKNNGFNMECFVFDGHGGMPPGDPEELQIRQSKYMQANIPVGVSFEIRYFIGAFYWVIVPDVVGMSKTAASQVITQANLVPKVIGIHPSIKDQSPRGHTYAKKGSTVTLKTDSPNITVIVPGVLGAKAHVARPAIENAGLVAIFQGSTANTVVTQQSPDGGDEAQSGDKVYLTMGEQ
jgi:hypothetical protein